MGTGKRGSMFVVSGHAGCRYRIHVKKIIPRHIRLKLLKTKDQEKILTTEKRTCSMGIIIFITLFSSEVTEGRKNVFKELK